MRREDLWLKYYADDGLMARLIASNGNDHMRVPPNNVLRPITLCRALSSKHLHGLLQIGIEMLRP
jgi:hypothetical protein